MGWCGGVGGVKLGYVEVRLGCNNIFTSGWVGWVGGMAWWCWWDGVVGWVGRVWLGLADPKRCKLRITYQAYVAY